MSDADVDGAHIRCLLLTLFHRYLRPLLDAGRVFAAVPPLHRIELSSPRKGQQKYTYTYSDAEVRRVLLDLERRGQRWKEPVQRYKGLGEMDAGQLAETTMDPQRRTLRRIRIEDAAVAGDMFSLLMGSESSPPPRLHRWRRRRTGPLPHRHLVPPARSSPSPSAPYTLKSHLGHAPHRPHALPRPTTAMLTVWQPS